MLLVAILLVALASLQFAGLFWARDFQTELQDEDARRMKEMALRYRQRTKVVIFPEVGGYILASSFWKKVLSEMNLSNQQRNQADKIIFLRRLQLVLLAVALLGLVRFYLAPSWL